MRASHLLGAARRPLILASVTCAVVLGVPLAALADWDQFQGGASHQGISDGPSAPLAVAWSNQDIELRGTGASGGLSLPVIAEDGTIVVVAPRSVLAFDGNDGSPIFSAERDLGASSQPALGEGTDGPIAVYTEGFGGAGTSASGSVTPTPSPATDEDEEGFDSHVNAVDLSTGEPAWGSPIQLGAAVQTPVTTHGMGAYVGDVGGHVTALELASGEIRWTAEVGSPIAGPITLDDGRALVTALGGQDEPSEIVAIDAASGEEQWRASAESASAMVTAPVVADGRILAMDDLGGVLAFDAEDGRFLWRSQVTNTLTQEPFRLRGVMAPAPVSADGQVFAVDVTGRVYAFDAETGAELWDHALNEAVQFASPLLTDDHLLVPTDSGTLFAVDRRTGHLVWRVDAGGALLRGLADAGDQLIGVTGADDAGLVAFEADASGRLIDEPSPTTPDTGQMLLGFFLGGLLVGAAVLLLARPLQRRLGPALVPADAGEDGG